MSSASSEQAIKLADFFSKEIPGSHFVPVFYMGSEDADLDELGHIYIEGGKTGMENKTNRSCWQDES